MPVLQSGVLALTERSGVLARKRIHARSSKLQGLQNANQAIRTNLRICDKNGPVLYPLTLHTERIPVECNERQLHSYMGVASVKVMKKWLAFSAQA